MALSRKVVPEEKLLHLIEKPGVMDDLSLNKKKKGALVLPRPGNLLSAFGAASFKKISLRGINKLLVVACVTITVALVMHYIKEERLIGEKVASLQQQIAKKVPAKTSAAKRDIPEMSTYLTETARNNPFHTIDFVKKPKERKKVLQQVNLKLVAIIWADPPQAIIEDSVSKKNYTVYKGSRFDKFTIKEITQSEIVLTSEDGEKVLR